MAYLDSRQRPSPASIAAVVVIHGAVAAALVLGLTVTGVIPEDEAPIPTWDIKKTPPPPEPPEPQPTNAQNRDRPITVPRPPIPFPPTPSELDTTTDILPPLPPLPPGKGRELEKVIPTPTPSFAAVAAKPRNDPQRWVTTEDYRSNWIRKEMTGRARFRLDILADGRVADCTITASSGHPELDAATCALVKRRAKFQPARGTEGEPVAGSYSNVIDWQLPE